MWWPSNWCRDPTNYFGSIVHNEEEIFVEASLCDLDDGNALSFVHCTLAAAWMSSGTLNRT